MHPLLWLSWRQTVNGIRRALTSPRRLIGILFIAGYYLMIFRPFRGASPSARWMTIPFANLPPIQVIDAVFFALFGVMSLLYIMSLTSYRGGHNPADIDVLFSTPVSPKHVLVFRMLRDSLVSLILPLLVMLMSWRSTSGAWESLSRDLNPAAAASSVRLITVSYCLMGLGWVALGYAVSLMANRPGLIFDRMRKGIGMGLIVFLAGLGYAVYSMLIRDLEGKGIVATLNNPWLRGILFLPNAAVKLTLAPITGSVQDALGGLATLIAFIAVCVSLALSQSSWLYEVAAQRVNQTVQSARFARSGDVYGATAQRMRAGKGIRGRFSFLARLRPKGPWALAWKDLINCLRGFSLVLFLIPLAGIAMVAMFAHAPADKDGVGMDLANIMVVVMMSFASTSMAASSGFVDMLNRIDILKPLPFSPGKTMFFEVLGKAVPGALTATAITLVALCIRPSAWEAFLAGNFLGIGASAVASVCIGLTTVLFPDIEDPSQRGLRGLVQLLVFLIFAVPPMGTYLGLQIGLKWTPLMATVPALGMGLTVALVGAHVAGNLFASFNPNE